MRSTLSTFNYLTIKYQCDPEPQCLKIAQKVSFKIASEASYVYILSGQKFIKNAKNGHFWRVFENAIFWVIFKHCADRLGTTSLFPLLSSKKIILVTSACFRSMATTAGDQKWLWKMVVLRTTLVHNVRGWWQGRNIVLQLIWDTDKKIPMSSTFLWLSTDMHGVWKSQKKSLIQHCDINCWKIVWKLLQMSHLNFLVFVV